jgi:tetratricopeptide (TPR) repeat protein
MSGDDAALANAIRRHEERLQRDPASLAFAQLADLYRRAGRVREATAVCRRGLARYPQYATARLILVKALMAEDDLEQALNELRTLLATSERDAQVHRLAADVRRRLGQIDVALEHLETAVRLDPADRESRALLALLQAAPRAGGETGLGRVLGDDTFVTATFGELALEQGLAEEAALVFTRILRKDPDHARARAGLDAALRARLRRKG